MKVGFAIVRVAPHRLKSIDPRNPELVDDRARDLVLQRKQLRGLSDLAVVALGPDHETVRDIRQLTADTETVAGPSDRAVQDRLHFQSHADFPGFSISSFERER